MTPFARPLSIALLAACGLLLAAHGAQAASTEADAARVPVAGQLPLPEACPSVDTRELADELAPTWDDAAKPSTVEVNFKLRRQHVYDVRPATASPRLYHQIRHAVYDLRCDGGDDQVHAVRFVVRYVDNDAHPASGAVADTDAGR
jgi:hypothetical protein